MLRLETIPPETLVLLKNIQTLPAFRDTRLVGGAAVSDIAAMKIAAVTNQGTRKDFVDVFFLLRFHSLEQLMNWYTQKYPDGNTYLTMRSLVYFADAEQEVMPKMLMPVEWESVKTTIRKAVRELDRKSP